MADLFTPTPEHAALRNLVRDFTEREVDPQAAEADRTETFNLPLFRRAGELGLLGVTAPERFGGAGLDAVAAVIVHDELSAADPGFCLAYLAHAMLFVNNLNQNAQRRAARALASRRVRRTHRRRHVHDGARGRHRRARDADHGACATATTTS